MSRKVRQRLSIATIVASTLVTLTAPSHAAISSFSSSMISATARFAYTFSAPTPASQVRVKFTSTTDTSLVWVLEAPAGVNSTTSGFIYMSPRNVLDPTVCASPYFCFSSVISAPAAYTASNGTVFFPNGIYTTQMSYLDANQVKYESSTSTMTTSTMTPSPTISAAFDGSKLKNRITMRVPLSALLTSGNRPTLTVTGTGSDSCRAREAVVTFSSFSANVDVWGVFEFSASDGTIVGFTSSAATTTTGLETLASGCSYKATLRWISTLRLPPYPTDPSYPTWASSSVQFDAPSKPDAPTTPVITRRDGMSFNVSWQPPTTDGMTPLTSSMLRISLPGSSTQVVFCTNVTECPATNLATDETYDVEVSVSNVVGQSPWISAGSITLNHCDYAPGPSINWSGCNKTSMDFTGVEFGASNFTNTNFTGSNFTRASISGADVTGANFTNAVFDQTTGTQIVGAATATLPSNWAIGEGTLGTIPDAATNLTSVRGNNRFTFSWNAPLLNGGLTISGYEIFEGTTPVTCTSVGPNSCEVTGLEAGSLHTYSIRARNLAGLSAAATSSVLQAISTPSAPTDLAVVVSDHTLTTTWSPPTNNGSAAVTEYKVTVSPGDQECTATTVYLHCVITGLTNGTAYTASVRALNEAGWGSALSVANNVPFGLPEAPTNITATAGARSAILSWTAAAPNGREVTRYTAYSIPARGTCSSTTTSCNMIGLLPNVNYTFKVAATSAAGGSLDSAESSPIRILDFPKVPTNFKVVPTKSAATFTWTKSAADGGSRILNYTVTITPGEKTCVATTKMTCSIKGLKPKAKYIARIAVATALGQATSTIRLQFVGK